MKTGVYEQQESSTLKTWAEADRPREKLLRNGAYNLTDSELLAIFIRTGTKNETAVDLAKSVLQKFNNDLTELARSGIAELSKIKGIGPVKAITIVAALELGRRRREAEASKRKKITSSRDIAELMIPRMQDLFHEEFFVIMLNRANEVIGKFQLSKGGISGTVVDPKLIFKQAIEQMASGIILCHNHPSGNIKPSEEDISLTKKIKEAGKMLDMNVLDHLIVAGNSYFSFADEGMM